MGRTVLFDREDGEMHERSALEDSEKTEVCPVNSLILPARHLVLL